MLRFEKQNLVGKSSKKERIRISIDIRQALENAPKHKLLNIDIDETYYWTVWNNGKNVTFRKIALGIWGSFRPSLKEVQFLIQELNKIHTK
tara:strand:+ start:6150 stop:6422 length:273 start_codon:yes stop_codon:yes gene_type:complete